MAQVMHYSGSVEKQHRVAEPIQHLATDAERGSCTPPYISLVHTFLLTLYELWCLSGASKNGYKPLIQLQIISQKETEFSARIGAKLTQ